MQKGIPANCFVTARGLLRQSEYWAGTLWDGKTQLKQGYLQPDMSIEGQGHWEASARLDWHRICLI
jgi:hypothetical protein